MRSLDRMMQGATALRTLPSRGGALLRRLRRRSSSNFKFAFLFLGPEQRDALREIYEFCRVIDDIVDERAPGLPGIEQARESLDHWRSQIAWLYRVSDTPTDIVVEPLTQSLARAHERYSFLRQAFDGIIDGCAMDLEQNRYASVQELERYCFGVASCVGLLCIAIFGNQSPAAQKYATHLGLALQYTNILRDVAEDAQRDRIYLPRELLERHGLRDSDILESCFDDRFIAVAKDFANLAEDEYDLAAHQLSEIEDKKTLLTAEVMGHTYHAILDELRSMQFNVFARRPGLRRRDKIFAAAQAIAGVTLPDRMMDRIRR